jgi:lycopene cyclase domain-containing protein
MSLLYGGALLGAIGCMVLLDHRFRLFFFAAPARAGVVLVLGLAFFLAWDAAGIGLGIFFRGDTPYMTGWQLAPELPVEEVGFLTLLCYLTMNLYAGAAQLLAGRRSGPA